MPLNILPTIGTDGVVYSANVPLTGTEADLGNAVGAQIVAPVPDVFGLVVLAVVQLTINGVIVANSTYVVMQTDLGDGVWVDVAWLVWNGSQGSLTQVLCGGGMGAQDNSFAQSRNPGQVPQPQANGSNKVPLGGRIRFVGQAKFTGGSSSAPGVTTVVIANIRYKLLAPR